MAEKETTHLDLVRIVSSENMKRFYGIALQPTRFGEIAVVRCWGRMSLGVEFRISLSKNAIALPWNNGQAEGQINRLKTLKRAMYGRAGPELMRARMLPLHHTL